MTPREYLAGLEFHGIKLGLDNIRGLLSGAGNPQNDYPTVHVAGTNGKGSVLAFLDAMLRAAGYRTGRYTSPHLIDVSERFLVSGTPIADADLDRHILLFRAIAERERIPVTYFEMATAVAFNYFKEAGVDIALVEVGMGGRFDATNVLTPVATAITPIDLDHMQYLGDSLEAIAGEKAGILKPGVPAVLGETRSPARDVIRRRALEIGAPLNVIGVDFRFDGSSAGGPFWYERAGLRVACGALGLTGPHQHHNAAVAVAVAETIRDRFPRLSLDAIEAGLAEARWPCRLERVLDSPPVIIDAAHNAAAFAALAKSMPLGIVVLAVSKDKHAEAMVRTAEQFAARLIVTQFQGPRALPAGELAAFVSRAPFEVAPSMGAAIDRAIQLGSQERPVLITGSIFAAGEARAYLIQRYGAPPLQF